MGKSVSGPVAVLVILLALLVLAVAFYNPRLAPPEKAESPRPPEPQVEQQEIKMARQGLRPLGITAVLAPLMEDRGKGVRVASVAPSSPAEQAGLKIGDRIDKFDGKPVPHPIALARALDFVKPSQTSTMVVLRSGKTMTLKVKGITPLPPEERLGS